MIKKALSFLILIVLCLEIISAGFVTSAATADKSFEESLKAFPESYRTALRTLHTTYPNWKFIADNVSISFNEAVKLESEDMRKQVSMSSQPISWRSMAEGSYDWSREKWIQSNNGWTGASKEVIAYYMDPRNFLNSSDVYMFLNQSYDSSINYEAGVKNIIDGTFMENNYSDSKDTKYGGSYAKVIIAAGKQAGVNPYILASKIRQEIGTKETDMVSGKYKGYEGYYNFFNIGASGSNGSVLTNGLKRAKSEGWNTRSAAIIGGAEFLAENYISAGQDTYFYQNFNIVNPDKIWHQYAQAVHDSLSTANSVSKTYINEKNLAISFKIPVYTSISDSVKKKPASSDKKNNYYFEDLRANGLSPSFSKYTYSYSLSVSGNTTFTVKPVKGAAYNGEDSYQLKKGTNKISLKVKSETGYNNTYTINVTASKDCVLKINNTGHYYEATVTKPTCTQGGYTTYKCVYCGNTYKDNNTAALGHKFSSWTLMNEGDKSYQVNTEVRTCSVCEINEYKKIIPYGLKYTISGNKTTITDYTGDWTKLTVPDEINGAAVVKIADNAFEGCAALTEITLPESVTEIGANAFKDCTSLTSVNIGFKVSSIGLSAFSGDDNVTVKVDSQNSYAKNYIETNSLKFTTYDTVVTAVSSAKVSLYGYDDIRLSWDEAFAADGYYVEYKKDGGSWSSEKTATGTSYDFPDLADDTRYDFRITAYIKNGNTVKKSAKKNVTGYTTKNLAATSKLTASLYGHDDVKLSWNKVSGATHYEVYYKRTADSKFTYFVRTGNLNINIPDLADNTKYTFRVFPCVYINNEYFIDSSNKDVTFSTTHNLKKPSNVKAQLVGYDGVKISWSKVSNAAAYRVYYRKSANANYSLLTTTTKLNYTKLNLADGKKYYIKIYALTKPNGSYFEDPDYASANITAAYNLTSPKKVKSSLYQLNTVKVSWNKVKNATHYKVYYKKSTASKYTLAVTTNKLNAQIPNLSGNTKYTFRVYPCVKVNGTYYKDSDYGTVSAKTSYNLASPKKVKAVLYGYDDVQFSWSRVSRATHYRVYYKKESDKSYTYYKTTSGRSVKKANLSDGVKYIFKVVPCIKMSGKYVMDNSYTLSNIYTLKKVSAPTVKKRDNGSVTVKWSDISNEGGFEVSRSTTKNGTKVVKTISANKTSANLSASKGKTYYYKVRAYKKVNGKKVYAPWSNVKGYKVS